MKRQILVIIIVSAFLGGFLGSLISVAPAEANLFKNFYDQYLKQFIQPKTDQQPTTNNEQPIVNSQELYAPTIDYEQAVVKAVEQSSPAVISIIISKDLPIIEQCPYNTFSD